MKCTSCQIMWSDPLNNFKSKKCPFCQAELPNDKEIRKSYISKGFDIQNGVLLRYLGEGGKVVIPDCVTEIGYGAFAYCRGLNEVSLSNSTTSVNTWAFYECSGLKSIVFQKSLTSIGDSAFLKCVNLEILSLPTSISIVEKRAFTCCNSLSADTIRSIKNINEFAI